MTDYGTVMLVGAGAVAGVMLVAWVVSVLLRDVSVVDVAWGAGLVIVAWVVFAVADGAPARKWLVVALTTLWGVRLTAYLAWRKRGEGEDFRYAELRRRHGKRLPLVSLPVVFGFQGLGMWVVSLPVLVAQVPDSPAGLTALDYAGAALWAVGMLFEVVGDFQLSRFRADPRNAGKVMDRGLWRYSRHPNYFGEFCMWWGLYVVALATENAWWTIAGPLVMSCVLLRISGVRAMEPHLRERRAGYADYARRTSAFFPCPPRPRAAG
jgi:steroid 5-alpha reductase family enzyme